MTYSDEILAKNPAVYYRLNETTGPNVADSSSNNNDGTATADVVFGGVQLFANDTNGLSIVPDDDTPIQTDASAIDGGFLGALTFPFSISFWCRANAISPYIPIMATHAEVGLKSGVEAFIDSNDRIGVRLAYATGNTDSFFVEYVSDTEIPNELGVGDVAHVIVNIPDADASVRPTFFINGVEYGATYARGLGGTIATNRPASVIRVGNDNSLGLAGNANISDVAVWESATDQAEADRLYQIGLSAAVPATGILYDIPIDYTPTIRLQIDFTCRITEVVINKLLPEQIEQFWGAISAGGVNARLFGDANLQTSYPLEIVAINTTLRTFTFEGRLPPLLENTADNPLFLFLETAGNPLPSANAKDVWSDYSIVVHGLNSLRDSTGNWRLDNSPSVTFGADGVRISGPTKPIYKKINSSGGSFSTSGLSCGAEIVCISESTGNINEPVDDRGYEVFRTDNTQSSTAISLLARRPRVNLNSQPRKRLFGVNGEQTTFLSNLAGNTPLFATTFVKNLGGIQDDDATFTGDNFLMTGNYDITNDPASEGGYFGIFRLYLDGIFQGSNNSQTGGAGNLGWRGNNPFNSTTLYLGGDNDDAELDIKGFYVRNAFQNVFYEDAQSENRLNQAAFFGTPTVTLLEAPPEPPEPPVDPPVSNQPPVGPNDFQAW